MVKKQNHDITKSLNSKGSEENEPRARKINASTVFETCTEQITPFGGLLGLIKFLDLIQLKEIFENLSDAEHQAGQLSDGCGYSDATVYRVQQDLALHLYSSGCHHLWFFSTHPVAGSHNLLAVYG